MIETLGLFALAALCGFGIAKALAWALPRRGRLRGTLLVLIPPGLLLVVFLIFTRGTPQPDEWIWMGIGLVYFWPYYLTFLVASLAETVQRRVFPLRKT